MACKAVKRLCITGIVLAAVALAAVLSRLTTVHAGYNVLPQGQWTIRVVNEEGAPLPGARFAVKLPGSCEPVSFTRDESGRGPISPFDDYTGPESIAADEKGKIHLRTTRAIRWSSSCWYLFWVWPIEDYPLKGRFDFLLAISSPGYYEATIPISYLVGVSEITVTLKAKH